MKFNNKKKIAILVTSCIAGSIILAALITLFISNFNQPEPIVTPTAENKTTFDKDVYGVLFLGSDEGATNTNGGNHTDSMTYVAVNKQTGEIIALPIYRDAFIQLTCADKADNANRIYRDYGVDCLKESVSALLGMPVDYYVYTRSDSFVEVLNTIGPITITPTESFCSNFGNDDTEYCFEANVAQEMTGNQMLAYARFRGNSSGEKRANRHVPMLEAITNTCVANKAVCTSSILKETAIGKIASDLPLEEVIQLLQITHFESLEVISGTNFEDENGWHQRIDADDLNQKVNQIRERFGVLNEGSTSNN